MVILPERYLTKLVEKDLKKKMVFIGGARQVGKATLAQSLIKRFQDGHPAYLNWDLDEDRRKIRSKQWPKSEPLIVLDEIHKYKNWRNFVKGIFDSLKQTHSFLITGSARLDHFRRGGDSMLGRYFYYRLHPYSLPELGYGKTNLELLFKYGGFPEPLLERNAKTLKRWHMGRLSHLVRSDLRDLENVKEIDKIEVLAEELPFKVGSPLSYNSLAEDLEVSPKTAKRWVEMLDSLYYCFRIPPYGSAKIRAVKKEQKLYLWDWSQIEEKGIRFENMTACLLLKFCHYHTDANGEKMELRYIRDTNRREIDFIVIKNKKPLFAVECKLKGNPFSRNIQYFKERMSIPSFYQISLDGVEKQIAKGIISTSFSRFCKYENMV
ncbi:MAG: AAA family ATPase [Halobacteriovoraceae bacterium]|nr:AAA family ATPase [Halobacteriovoraceae bacterium]